MPRPVKTGVLTPMELRITPPDGKPITDWMLDMPVVGSSNPVHFAKLLACEEGGIEDVRLHYHVYLETWRSRSWIIKWIYTIARCKNGEQGNSVFFSGKPHDNTIGYVVKHGNVVCRHGIEETFLTEWLAKSKQYRSDKDAKRKRKQRIEKAFTHQVRETVSATLRDAPDLRTPEDVMNLILREYEEHKKMYPSRSSMEIQIVSLLAPYHPATVRAFYLRSFETRY